MDTWLLIIVATIFLVCIAVGYENVSSFRRKFKKELGITPSQYRNGTEPVTEKSRGESQ